MTPYVHSIRVVNCNNWASIRLPTEKMYDDVGSGPMWRREIYKSLNVKFHRVPNFAIIFKILPKIIVELRIHHPFNFPWKLKIIFRGIFFKPLSKIERMLLKLQLLWKIFYLSILNFFQHLKLYSEAFHLKVNIFMWRQSRVFQKIKMFLNKTQTNYSLSTAVKSG